jgi:hypothetical protein
MHYLSLCHVLNMNLIWKIRGNTYIYMCMDDISHSYPNSDSQMYCYFWFSISDFILLVQILENITATAPLSICKIKLTLHIPQGYDSCSGASEVCVQVGTGPGTQVWSFGVAFYSMQFWTNVFLQTCQNKVVHWFCT